MASPRAGIDAALPDVERRDRIIALHRQDRQRQQVRRIVAATVAQLLRRVLQQVGQPVRLRLAAAGGRKLLQPLGDRLHRSFGIGQNQMHQPQRADVDGRRLFQESRHQAGAARPVARQSGQQFVRCLLVRQHGVQMLHRGDAHPLLHHHGDG
ncbi:hypothetical protein [Azospirillum sp. INR13]|uniref:hypothetical protein n=1 Tax=Azospirillum sp. INR13 TaxID=2596919 RepID=UPI00210411EF|nr:hypothetical protein [Azospirillum sp. INR13]